MLCIEIISKQDPSHKPQAMVISCLDLYVFLGCYLPIQPPLKQAHMVLGFLHVLIQVTNYKICDICDWILESHSRSNISSI